MPEDFDDPDLIGDYDPAWWQRTFAERHAEFVRFFGRTRPPGSADGNVLAFEWDYVQIPGACCMVFPPTPGDGRDAAARDFWVYATHGLAQPLTRGQADAIRASGVPTSYDAEFLILTRNAAGWAPAVLQQVMWYARDMRPLNTGDRLPFAFERQGDGVEGLLGDTDDKEPASLVGATRALIAWPLLAGGPASLTTSTGSTELRVLTTITQGEWDFARRLSSAHLLLLLRHGGVGQLSAADRSCVVTDPEAGALMERIESLDADEAMELLDTADDA
jgi:hypothetical protein